MNTFTSIQKSRTLFLLFMLSFTVLTGAFRVCAQTEYQSRATGNWTNTGTWSSRTWNSTTSTWSAWANATTYPGQNPGTGAVSIIGGFAVTLNASITNQFSSLTIGDDIFPPTQPGIDQLRIPQSTSFTLNTLLVFIKDDGNLYWVDAPSTLTLAANAVIKVTGTNAPMPLTSGKCNANAKLVIGTNSFANCEGGATYKFDEINGAGGTIDVAVSYQNICYGSLLNLSATASGLGSTYATIVWTATGPGNYTYSRTFNTSVNALTDNVSISNLIAGTYTFKVAVTDISTSANTNFDEINITVYPTSVAGSASSDQTICYNTAPAQLSLTGSVGTIQWQSSTDNSTFINITEATSSTYSPGALTQTTYYRAIVKSGVCSTATSNTVTITVNPASVSGTASSSQTICYNTAPTQLSLAGSVGTIQWQSSTDNLSFTDILGATSANYSPGALTQTMYYKAVVKSGVCSTATSNTVTITVNPATVAGTASSDQTICYNTVPSQLSLTGSVGTIQWQSSTDNSTFNNITGATSSMYSSGALTQTTYYRAVVKSGVCSQATSNTVTITVIPASVGGTATATKPTLCSGFGTTITLTGHTGTIQWQSSPDNTIWNNIAGETLATYTTPNLTTTTYYRAVVTSGSCTSANSTIASVTVTDNMWEGTYSEAWENVNNWTCKIPLTGEDVVFSNSAVNNLVVPDGDKIIGNLTNNSDKALIIQPTKSLTIGGKATVNSPDRILIQSAKDAANGSLIFTNPGANSAVPATVEMYSKAYKGDKITYYDEYTKEYYTVSYRWQYFGIPVQSATYNTVFEAQAPVSYVRVSDETKNGNTVYYDEWTQLYTTDQLEAFKGYEITQNTTQALGKKITFKGALLTGNQNCTLTYTTKGTSYDTGSGYNILGNSFTAGINIPDITFSSGVDETVFLYNTGSLNDWYTNYFNNASPDGQYETPGSYYAVPKNTALAIQKQIPSMQGFMLITTTNNVTVTLPYSSVLKNAYQQRAPSADNTNLSYLTADVISKSGGDRVWLFSQPGTSRKYDNGWDGRKITLYPGLSLYVDEGKDQLQVSTSEDLDKTYLSFMAGKDTEYTLRINKSKLTGYMTLYLTDLETKTVTDLSAQNEINYPFTATNTEKAERRFLITSKDKKNNDPKGQKVRIFNSGSTVRIDNPSDENGRVLIFDMFGQLRQTGVMNAASVTEITTSLPPSVYVVRVLSVGTDQSGKIVIRH